MDKSLVARGLLGLAFVLFLASVVFQLADLHGNWYFLPVSWWRASVAAALRSIGVSVLRDRR